MSSARDKKTAEFLLGLIRGLSFEDLRVSFNYWSVQAVRNRLGRMKGLFFKRGERYFLTEAGRVLVLKSNIARDSADILYPVFQHNVWIYFGIAGKDHVDFRSFVNLRLDEMGLPRTGNDIKGVWSYYFELAGCKVRLSDGFVMIHPDGKVFDRVREALAYSKGEAWRVVPEIERVFAVCLEKKPKGEVHYSKQEYALLQTEIAGMYKEYGDRLMVREEGGAVRVLIDFSGGEPHFEGVHAVKSPDDMVYFQRHFTDLCLNRPPLISEVVRRLEKLEKR